MGFSDLDWDLKRNDLLEEHAEILIAVARKTIRAISFEIE